MEQDNMIGNFKREDFNKMTVDEKWSLMCDMNAQIEDQKRQVAELKELLNLLTQDRYCPSSEQMRLFFPELEALSDIEKEAEEEKVVVKEHERKVERKEREVFKLPPNTPVVSIDHTEDAPETITRNGIVYKKTNRKHEVLQALRIPTSYVIEKHEWPIYEATVEDESIKEKTVVLFKEEKVEKIGASPALISEMVVSKFDDALPLYRQEEIFRRSGFALRRQRMASWIISYYEMLKPLEQYFKKKIFSSPAIYMDESPVQVLDIKGPTGKPSTNMFMSFTTGSVFDDKKRRCHALVLFKCIQGRSHEVLLEDIISYNYEGYLMSDGLSAYGFYEESKHARCWVHAVRNFKKAFAASNNKCKEAQVLISYFQKLYEIENRLRKELSSGLLDKKSFLSKRKEEAGKVIDDFFRYAESVQGQFSQSSQMGKGFTYIFSARKNLYRYLDIIELSPDNNISERYAKTFAVGRNNWMFAQSLQGCEASAFFYSLVENAKNQGISVDDYVELVCTFGPYAKSEEDYKALLPWNADLSRLEDRKALRKNAKPDAKRTKPYFIVGHTH